jgi:AcrR family transcriptional regulator
VRVLEAAKGAFAEVGPDLPMEELARRADVGIGTVYRHFPNKEALLDALLEERLTEIIEKTRAALERDDSWEAFKDLVRDGTSMQAHDIAYCEVVMARKQTSNSPAVAELRAQMESETAKLIERAQAEGKLRTDFTVGDMGFLFASLAGVVRAAGPDGPWRRQLEFTLDGLRAS